MLLSWPHSDADSTSPVARAKGAGTSLSPWWRETHSVLSPSRPLNMPLRTDSSWLTVRCSSLTDAAPSKAPSSISDTLLLLRLLQGGAGSRLGQGGSALPP